MDKFDSIKENMIKNEQNLSKNACLSKDAVRLKEEKKDDYRTEYQKDIDRIIYSLSYNRYIHKTQVYSLTDNDHISKRMTHVQYVSRISRTIARALNLNEDLCEAIALGHDIGHVPYGHVGEYILDEISKEKIGKNFAHNLQSVRHLMVIENCGKGLNLSLQTLDGIMAHNGEMLQEKYMPVKKDVESFLQEFDSCYSDSNNIKKLHPMTLEGCIVRISDVIAYIGRDIEDAIRLGLLNKNDLPKEVLKVLGSKNGEIINNIISDIVENSMNKNYISMSKEIYDKMEQLKKFNYEVIYAKAFTKEEKIVLKQKFNKLYEVYYDALINDKKANIIWKDFLSNMDEEYLKSNIPGQIVIDYISGMTDNYFEKEYEKYF